jgi:hypothetical protein
MMTFWKTRADRQDRYRREIFMGEVTAAHADGACDVLLPGGEHVVARVPNISGIAFQAGNRVVLQRLPGRQSWQITGGTQGGAPVTYVNPNATLGPAPDGTWEGLARTADDPTGIAAYVDTRQWPLAALTQSGAEDGQVPLWKADAGAWVAGSPAAGGVSLDHLRAPAASGLASLLNGAGAIPVDGIGAWYMSGDADMDNGAGRGAFCYANRLGDLRRGAFWPETCVLAYWKMDELSGTESITDCSLGQRDLTPYNLSAVPSLFFGSRVFNGTSSYAVCPAIDLTAQDRLSVMLWVRPMAMAPSQYLLYQYNGICVNTAGNGAYLQFSVTTANGTRYALARFPDGVNLADGQWHFIACVYTGAQLIMYLDGVQLGDPVSHAGTILSAAPATSLYLGVYAPHWGGQWGYFYNGAMAEVIITPAVSSAAVIDSIWANRATGTVVSSRVLTPVPCRYGMLGERHLSIDGSVAYELSSDNGATWTPAEPWCWTRLPEDGTEWRARVLVTGRTMVKRLGFLCIPDV